MTSNARGATSTGAPAFAWRLRRPFQVLAAVALTVALIGGPTASALTTNAKEASGSPVAATNAAVSGIAGMLPASTVLFAGYDLSLAGAQSAFIKSLEGQLPGDIGLFGAATTSKNAAGCAAIGNVLVSWSNGPAVLAVTDPSVLSSATTTSAAVHGVTVLAQVRSGLQIPGVVAKNKLGTTKADETYAGVQVYKVQFTACGGSSLTSSPAYAAVTGNEGIIAFSHTDIQKELDVLKSGAATLSGTASYQRVIAKLPPTGFGYVYINTAALVKGVASNSLNPLAAAGTTTPSTGGVSNDFGPAGISFSTQSRGIAAQGVVLLNTPVFGSVSPTPNKAAAALPAGTMFYLSVNDLKDALNSALQAASAADKSTAQTLGTLQLTLGSVLGLLDGEAAVALLPTGAKSISGIAKGLAKGNVSNLPLAVMVDVSKHPEAQTVISTLLGTLGGVLSSGSSSGASLQLTPVPLAHGDTAYVATAGYGYAMINKSWLVISTAIKSVAASIQGVVYGATPSLAKEQSYQQATSLLPQQPTSVTYVDLSALGTTLEGALLPGASSATRSTLSHLHAVEVSTRSEDNGLTFRIDGLLLES